jgi:diketogulonate reductase-like aldo/keto reductase
VAPIKAQLRWLWGSFSVDDLKVLLASATVKPVVNQILLHPYVYETTKPLLDYMKENHIVPEGYSSLIPLTSRPGGPVDKPMNDIAKRLKIKPEQVLLAWSKAKGWVGQEDAKSNFTMAKQLSAVIVTISSRKDRLEGFLDVGDIELTDDDVKAIDNAGKKGQQSIARREMTVKVLKWATVAGLAGYIGVKTFM